MKIKTIAKSGVMVLVGDSVFALSSVLFMLVLAKVLSPRDFGDIALVLLLCGLMVMLASGGATSFIIYSIARKKLYLSSLFVYLMLSYPISMLIVFIVLKLLSIPVYFISLFPVSIAILLHTIILALIQGMSAFRYYLFMQIAVSIFRALSAGFVYVLSVKNINSIILLYGTFMLFVPAIAVIPVLRKVKTVARTMCFSTHSLAFILRYSMKSLGANVIAFLNYNLDNFMIKLMLGSHFTGVYYLAQRIARPVWFISGGFAKVAFPFISKKREIKLSSLKKWIFYISGICILISAITYLVFVFFVFDYYKDYKGSDDVLLVLLVAVSIFSIDKVVSSYLLGRNRHIINLYAAIVTLFVNLLLNLYLIPVMGVMGSAIATLISYTTATLLTILLAIRYEKRQFNT